MRLHINVAEIVSGLAGLFVCSIGTSALSPTIGVVGYAASLVAGNATVALVKWLQKRRR